MTSLIQIIDGSAIGIGPATSNLKRGLRENNFYSAFESICELGSAFTTLTSYFGKGLTNIGVIWSIFSDHIPYMLAVVSQTMSTIPMREALGVLGIFTASIRFIRESMALGRQYLFLSIFKEKAWKGENIRSALVETIDQLDKPAAQSTLPLRFRAVVVGKKGKLQEILTQFDAGSPQAQERARIILGAWIGRDIREPLVGLTKLPLVEIERSLPVWLFQDLEMKGGKEYLEVLLTKVRQGDLKATHEAKQLLDQMESYASKKRIVHILKMAGAFIGALACIGCFVAFPFALTLFLMTVTTILATAAYLVNTGYVENRQDEFSLKICIPEFILNIPQMIQGIPRQIEAFIQSKIGKKAPPSSFELFERHRVAKAVASEEMVRSAVRLKRMRLPVPINPRAAA